MTKTILKTAALLAPDRTARWAARRFLTPRPLKVREEEAAVLETATRGEWLENSELRLRALVWEGDGPTVLLVHGWNGNVGQMTPFVAPLRARGFRVVAHSAPAHGESAGTLSHVPIMARAVAAMARRYGPLHAIVAHSVGATAAARAVQCGVPVRRLALVAPATGPARWVAKFTAAAGMARIGPRVVTAVEELAGIRLADLELAAIGRALDVPVLAVHDKDDPLVPLPDATHAVAAMRDGGLVVTSGLGHFRILRERAIVREVTAFVEHGASAPAGASATEVLGTAA